MTPLPVVVIDPGRDAGMSLGFGDEVFQRAQLELEGGVPGFDGGVVQR
jgi:hypothetical protein